MDIRETLNVSALAIRNIAGTFLNTFSSATTAARTWTFPDKSGTVAMTSDISGANSYAIITEAYSAGTNGKASSITTATVRQLNTVVSNPASLVTLTNGGTAAASFQYNLGVYPATLRIRFSAQASNCDTHQAWILQASGPVALGNTAITIYLVGAPTTTESSGEGIFTVTGNNSTAQFQLIHWTQVASTFGTVGSANSGKGEVYAQVTVEKIG